MPNQFIRISEDPDINCAPDLITPETNLLRAILRRTLLDMRADKPSADMKQACNWVINDSIATFSFNWILDQLDNAFIKKDFVTLAIATKKKYGW